MEVIRFLPRSSEGFVHSLAQWPVLPHRAQLLRLFMYCADHFFGLLL